MNYWRKARGTYRAASARPGIRAASIIVALSLLLAAGAVATSAAAADDYPTYADVQAAKNDATKKQALVTKIKGGLAALQKKVDSTQAAAVTAGDAANAADEAYQEQAVKTKTLQDQADAANTAAAAARKRAGQLLVQQYRSSGNTDISLELLLNGKDSKDVLYSLGMSKTLVDQAQGIFDAATQAKNTAQSLTDQAKVAADELAKLKTAADATAAAANLASQAAAAALQEQQDNLDAQQELLADLQSTAKTTAADYQKGVEARAAARAAAAAKSNGVGVFNSDPPIVNGDWAVPEAGHITSGFGYRLYPYAGFHLGTDIGAACGSYIYAAHSGTVSYSGWNGIYGNFIRIDIGSGVQNEYGHILMGGLLVKVGDKVTVGQHIANVGKTGGATGCHLHFGVRIDGLVTDPVPFMRGYGVNLG